jgi:hypothetical protein
MYSTRAGRKPEEECQQIFDRNYISHFEILMHLFAPATSLFCFPLRNDSGSR